MAKTRTPGITVLADGRLFIDKRYLGVRIGLRVGAITQEQAEERLRVEMARIECEQERKAHARPIFADCAARYVAQSRSKRSIDVIKWHVQLLARYIGNLEPQQIHDATLEPFIKDCLNRWVVAWHKLSKDALAVRYDRYEIIGEPEVRQPTNDDGHFNPAQKPSTLCRLCEIVRDQPLVMKPMHLVHPETGDLMLFDVRGEAVCPTCGARYRRTMNVITLVDASTA